MKTLILAFLLAASTTVLAAPKQVRVFIALCDNNTQRIAPVGAKIGNGDDADANLYWGCSDGFGSFFKRANHWKIRAEERDVSTIILRRLFAVHADGDIEITAEAYRGSEIKRCLTDFQIAAASGEYDLVAYIGHNGLMEFEIAPPALNPDNKTAVVVLCCLSERYFDHRLRALGCEPILMTQQLMYPGSFLLDAAITSWKKGGSKADIRAAAGRAYAANQTIGVRAATGVFTN
jgi:hypothetical protein